MATPISLPRRTVADAMLTTPKTHGLEVTVSEAEDAFADPHVHMLLLTRDGELHGTLLRSDLRPQVDSRSPAIELAGLEGRTIGPDQLIDDAVLLLDRRQTRRLAVTDVDRRLLGLLCLKKAHRGFCNDADILARTRRPYA